MSHTPPEKIFGEPLTPNIHEIIDALHEANQQIINLTKRNNELIEENNRLRLNEGVILIINNRLIQIMRTHLIPEADMSLIENPVTPQGIVERLDTLNKHLVNNRDHFQRQFKWLIKEIQRGRKDQGESYRPLDEFFDYKKDANIINRFIDNTTKNHFIIKNEVYRFMERCFINTPKEYLITTRKILEKENVGKNLHEIFAELATLREESSRIINTINGTLKWISDEMDEFRYEPKNNITDLIPTIENTVGEIWRGILRDRNQVIEISNKLTLQMKTMINIIGKNPFEYGNNPHISYRAEGICKDMDKIYKTLITKVNELENMTKNVLQKIIMQEKGEILINPALPTFDNAEEVHEYINRKMVNHILEDRDKNLLINNATCTLENIDRFMSQKTSKIFTPFINIDENNFISETGKSIYEKIEILINMRPKPFTPQTLPIVFYNKQNFIYNNYSS